MISNIDARVSLKISEAIKPLLQFCSLLEYYPTAYNSDVECRSSAYVRQQVAWRDAGLGLMVNSLPLEFIGLDEPTMIMAVGLHEKVNSTSVNAWGALGRTMRAVNGRVLLPAGSVAIRIG